MFRTVADDQTGAPVGKNSDAIKKALDAIAADLGEDEDDDDNEDGDVNEVDISDVRRSLLRRRRSHGRR